MLTISISYTSQLTPANIYDFTIDNFGDNAMPRTYVGEGDFSFSANGTSIISGPAYGRKYQWVISTLMVKDDAVVFDRMFRDWDLDRAAGYPAACGVIDQTWGDTVSTNVIFLTPPSYVRTSPVDVLVSFGLQEV